MTFKMLLAGSAIAVATACAFPSTAAAQSACDRNGVAGVPIGDLGPTSLECGNYTAVAASGPNDDVTAVGSLMKLSGDSVTIVGSSAGGITQLFTLAGPYSPPSIDGATAVGAYALAVGTGIVSVGDQAIVGDLDLSGGALGITSFIANSTAIGSHSFVSASNSTAVGYSAEATALSSTAVGQNAAASGVGGTATGVDSTASGGQSAAFGLNSSATGNHATALGAQATASVADATAVGFGADATATGAVAIGNQSEAAHVNSVALGAGSVTTAANQVQVGGRTISGVTAGVAATDAVNVGQLTTATAGIAGFDTRIDAIEALALDFNEDLDRIDKRSAAGTAAAIALSGAMFLPGKTFNLTGNVGAYRGAVAGALQFGALVSDKMAVNAGVAHGFNKGGKTGVRAGFTLGW